MPVLLKLNPEFARPHAGAPVLSVGQIVPAEK